MSISVFQKDNGVVADLVDFFDASHERELPWALAHVYVLAAQPCRPISNLQ